MTIRRMHRANKKTTEERKREQELRTKLQNEKPSLDDLIDNGECDPDTVMTMGMYFDLQTMLQALKQDRKQAGLSITDVAKTSRLDRAVISRLENGKQDNPTAATLMRYAAAIGKRLLWSYEDAMTGDAKTNGKVRRRTK